MAGPYWHMLIADRITRELNGRAEITEETSVMARHPEMVVFGANAPDITFYPGGDKRISDLAHNNQPADLGRALIGQSKTDIEKAFAFGWMTHIITDIVTHKLVNQIVAERQARSSGSSQTFSENQVGHYRAEWGIDLRILNTPELSRSIPDLRTAFKPLPLAFDLLKRVFADVYGVALKSDDWEKGGASMITYNRLFSRIWKLTGRTGDSIPPIQGLKSLVYHASVLPVVKILCRKPSLTEASIIIPIVFPKRGLSVIKTYTEKAVERFFEEMKTDFNNIDVTNLE